MPKEIRYFSTRKIALLGLLFALAAVLSFFESFLVAFLALPPGIKLGISNIPVLFAALCLDICAAWSLSLLKALFVLLTRGAVAGFLSLCGGIFSVAVMSALILVRRVRMSIKSLSICGAMAHNIGQILAAMLIMKNRYVIYYLPILILGAIASGYLTGSLYQAASPNFGKLLKGLHKSNL